ncbi:autophagy-related protein 22-like protein [Hyaloraphidium curvatum]|nr:autophagy-related protein 22-like protein [Hyaloraphidium curvatum]
MQDASIGDAPHLDPSPIDLILEDATIPLLPMAAAGDDVQLPTLSSVSPDAEKRDGAAPDKTEVALGDDSLVEAVLAADPLETEHGQPVTTKRELWGWWLYDWANSVYSSVALGILLPLIIEDLCWRAGTSDPATGAPCADRDAEGADNTDCFIPWAGSWTRPSSYAFYITAIGVGVQAFLFISIGALADYGGMRKGMLIFFAVLGSVLCVLFLAVVNPSLYWLAGLLAVLSNVAFGASIVFYNSYLPLLVESHPEHLEAVLAVKQRVEDGESDEQAHKELLETRDALSNRVSTHGFAMGYASGTLLLAISGGILFATGGSTYVMQAMIALTGVWWLGFSVFTFLWLKPRPRPPLPPGENYFIFSWKKIIRTFGHAPKLKDTFIYLAAYFIFSDTINTISAVATLFGRVELNMSSTQLIIIAIVAPFAAFLGNYIWLWIAQRFKWSSKTGLIVLLAWMAVISLYGLIGYSGVFGLIAPAELYGAAVWYGLGLGAVQSFARVMMSELVPPGCEAEFFSLYEITDKGSSWMGPLIVGAIYARTGYMRDSFIYLFVVSILPFPILYFVSLVRGREAAKHFKLE